MIGNYHERPRRHNMENKGIESRERSPLVVSPKMISAAGRLLGRRERAELAEGPGRGRAAGLRSRPARTKQGPDRVGPHPDAVKLNWAGPPRPRAPTTIRSSPAPPTTPPGSSPSQLGYEAGLFGMLKGNKSKWAEFRGRTAAAVAGGASGWVPDALADYAYGTGPEESLRQATTS